MFIRVLHSSVVFLLAASAFAAQVPVPAKTKSDRLLVRLVEFKRVAVNVRYEGVEADSGDVSLHFDPLPYGGRNYY
jgi:hypothetical protein